MNSFDSTQALLPEIMLARPLAQPQTALIEGERSLSWGPSITLMRWLTVARPRRAAGDCVAVLCTQLEMVAALFGTLNRARWWYR